MDTGKLEEDKKPQPTTSGSTQTQTVSTGTTETNSVDMPTGPDPVE